MDKAKTDTDERTQLLRALETEHVTIKRQALLKKLWHLRSQNGSAARRQTNHTDSNGFDAAKTPHRSRPTKAIA